MDFVIITVLLISLMAAYGYREKSKEKDGIIDNLISQNDNLYTQWEESKKDYKRLLQEKNDIINNFHGCFLKPFNKIKIARPPQP